MSSIPTRLIRLADRLVILRLQPGSDVPNWANQCSFVSITRSPDELSIVAPKLAIPEPELVDGAQEWSALRFAGTLDFSLVGVIAKLSNCLAQSNISVFVISTHDTDYVLVPQQSLEKTHSVLTKAGFQIEEQDSSH